MSKESKSRILESSCDSKRKKSFSISRYRKPLEDSSTISLYDSTYEEEENTIIFNLPPVDRFSSQQKHPNSTPETTNNCFLLSLRWLCQYLSCFRFRPLILIFFKKKNLNCNSSSNHRSTENQRERSPPISLAVTHNSKQQLDILDINRAQMYPLSRNHDFDLNDRRLSCESTTSPSLVSFNFFPSSPFHSVKTNQFNFEPKYKKFNPTFSSTISQHISKKHFSNTQTLNCSHLSLRGSYTLNRHHNNPFRMSDENSLTDNLSKQKWISEQAMFSRDYQELRDEKRKRTILIKRQDRSYGFTLQTYGIQQKKDGEVELITYVDHVDFGGPACKSGLLEGDVIVSVNGKDMEKADHSTLVNFIKSCDTSMRLVVRFEDCVQKVNLHARFLKMKILLSQKMAEYERICQREKELLAKMNRGNSQSLKSVSSWTRLPSIHTIFPTSQSKESSPLSAGDSFKSTRSAISQESKALSMDSGFASNNSYSRAENTLSTPNYYNAPKSKMHQSESCYVLKPITSVSEATSGQESAISQDKLFITRL